MELFEAENLLIGAAEILNIIYMRFHNRNQEKMEMNYPNYRWYVLFTLIVAHSLQGMALIGPTPLVGTISETLN
jgi:hypothetical protein